MRFDLTDMRLFVTVAEHGSLTRGAAAMNLALASASARVSGMEAALGAPLLERTRRGARPTPAGDTLIRHARLILGQVEQMRGELRQFAAGLKGRIRLLANTAALASLLPPALGAFLSDHPDLSVDLEERPSADIAFAVAEGRADLGLVADITDLTALQTRLLARDQLVVAIGRSHPLASRTRVTFTEIVGEAFVGLSDAALEIDLAERAARLGRPIHTRVRLRNVAQLAPFIAAGIGIAILPAASTAALAEAGLVVATLDEPWASRRLYLCARDFNSLTPQAGLLARHLITAATAEPYSSASDPAA